MYKDMHIGVYNLTRRLGEVVGGAQPQLSPCAAIGSAPLSTNTFAADRQQRLKPA